MNCRVCSRETTLLQGGACDRCQHWRLLAEKPLSQTIINGRRYIALGGGRERRTDERHDLLFFNGATVSTFALFDLGPVPESLRGELPDTAWFLTPSGEKSLVPVPIPDGTPRRRTVGSPVPWWASSRLTPAEQRAPVVEIVTSLEGVGL